MVPNSRTAPRYGSISVAAPFLRLAASLGFLELTGGFRALNNWPDLTVGEGRLAALAMAVVAGSCLAGLASAFAAFVRSEGWPVLGVLGLILNAALPLLFLRTSLELALDWRQSG
jgi:hypothetical protein